MLFALLALAIMGMSAITALQNKRLDLKREAGAAEATVLERLRNGAQALVDEQLVALQRGEPVSKNGVVLAPAQQAGGELVWAPTIDDLRTMGYLPPGWDATRSALNDAPYRLSLTRLPVGCVPSSCDISGLVVLAGPLRDSGRHTAVDGVVIGPILTRSGADGGVSLATNPNEISGFNGAWRLPNPVPGAPPGVVAMRFGTQAAASSQFLRIRDDRDPRLAGDLSVDGRGRFQAGLSVLGSVAVGGNGTGPCAQIGADGGIELSCAGGLNAPRAAFAGTTEISESGIRTERVLEASAGMRTASAMVFPTTDPTGITVGGGVLTFRGESSTLGSFEAGNLHLPRSVIADRIVLRGSVVEGAACSTVSAVENAGTAYGVTPDGSLAGCLAGRWVVTHRFGTQGALCSAEGAMATSHNGGEALICRGSRYVSIAMLLSGFVLQRTVSIALSSNGAIVQKPDCQSPSGVFSEALIIIVPSNEDSPVSLVSPNVVSGINRFAIDNGDHWVVTTERSIDASVMNGRAIGQLYCYYGQP